MNKAEAAREAKALVALWMWEYRATDDKGWREGVSSSDQARIAAELDRIEARFEKYGPPLFVRKHRTERREVHKPEARVAMEDGS